MAVAVVALLVGLAATPSAAQNLVENGDLTRGVGNLPAGWRIDRWKTDAGVTEFAWIPPAGDQPGQVTIENLQENDARFVQDVRVEERTWYHISAKVKTENVGAQAIGAYVSLMEGFQNTNDVKGTEQEWQPVEMYLKTEKWQDRLQIALRLGGYSSLNTGKAWFSDVSVTAVSGPPPNATQVFQPQTRVGGVQPLGLWGLILLLGILTAALWYYLRPAPGEDRGTPAEMIGLAVLLLAVLAAKLWAAPDFGYMTDLGTYKAWALRLAERGPADFYAPDYFCDYPPGYLYILWIIGHVYQGLQVVSTSALSTLIIKVPSIVTDLLTSWLLYVLLRPRVGARLTWAIVLAYTLNPAVIFNSAIWGQTDSLFTLELFLGVVLLLERRIAFAWAVIMVAALTKPQALIFLPLLASWPGNWDRPERPVMAAVTGAAVGTLLTLPFVDPFGLAAHYTKGAAYYAETSVNAFNLMALLGGFRQSDSGMLGFMPYKTWALVFVLAFFGFLAWLIYRRRNAEMYMYLCFLVPFGFFMLSTRMHERYLFPCLLFLALLLPKRPRLWLLFVGLTITYYLNLWYILRALNSNVFLQPYEPFGVAVSVANVGLFALAIAEAVLLTRTAPAPLPLPSPESMPALPERPPAPVAARAAAAAPRQGRREAPARRRGRLGWAFETGAAQFRIQRLDVVFALLLVLVGGALRFWELGEPDELVFDEVYFVEQGKNYLRGKEFMDPHPPFAKLAIGSSVAIFGNEADGYRVLNAVCGTLLIGVAYFMGRKLVGDGIAGFVAAAAVAFDGLFIVDSRIAVIDIWYVTFGALAYLLLFQYLRTPPAERRPTILIPLGIAIGLNLASKLFIPAFTWLTVVLFLSLLALQYERERRAREPWRRGLAPAALVTAAGGATYLAVYLPHYYLGWWDSVWDIPRYFSDVIDYEAAVADATHPYSSKWYTWPFLLRPVWYHFKDVPDDPSHVVGVWGGGNPLVWWGGFAAILVVAARAVRERHLASLFLTAAFILHYVVWSWIGRTLFQYHYLPSLYASVLALAMVLTMLWRRPADDGFWVGAGVVLLFPILPTVLGPFPQWGILLWAGIVAVYGAAVVYRTAPFLGWPPGRVVVVTYAVIGLTLAAYFYPIWSGQPIPRQVYNVRMWFQQGPARWI